MSDTVRTPIDIAARQRRTWNALKAAVKCVLALTIAGSIWAALRTYADEFATLQNVDGRLLTIGIVLCLVYRIVNAAGWPMVLHALNQPMPMLTGIRIWLTSEACRWLPGSVWSYGSRAYQAKKWGTTMEAAGASLALELLLTIAAWVAASTALLTSAHARSILGGFASQHALIAPAIAGSLALGLLSWRIGRRWIMPRLIQAHDQWNVARSLRPSGAKVLQVLGFYSVMCLLNGVSLYFVAMAVQPSELPLMGVTGANAVAWLVGFFAVMAPGGLLVREGALAGLLVMWLPMEAAVTVAILWRVVQIGVEVVCMAGAVAPSLIASARFAASPTTPSQAGARREEAPSVCPRPTLNSDSNLRAALQSNRKPYPSSGPSNAHSHRTSVQEPTLVDHRVCHSLTR